MDLEYVRCSYPDLKIISINDKARDKLKKINSETKSNHSPIGKSCFELYPIDLEQRMETFELHLTEKGNYSYIGYQNYIVGGERRFFKTINEPILGLDNEVIEIVFITTDITEEVQEKNKMEETLEMQNQIFTTISHELKTPLNVIFSVTQLLERDLKVESGLFDKEDISEKIRIIKQNCYRFTKLVNNIIDLSRMESGFYKAKFSNENIVEIIENIVDSVSSYVGNAGLRIIFDTDIEEKIMAVDVDKMERVMLNLISNAVKFSPKGETIYINIEDKGDTVRVLVRDCGVGIGPDHLNTIFDRYKKVDNSLYKNSEGSGLGLSLINMIAQSVGAQISVESELGKGSIFIIEIPVKILDESEVKEVIKDETSRKEQLNIEFSDIYTK